MPCLAPGMGTKVMKLAVCFSTTPFHWYDDFQRSAHFDMDLGHRPVEPSHVKKEVLRQKMIRLIMHVNCSNSAARKILHLISANIFLHTVQQCLSSEYTQGRSRV